MSISFALAARDKPDEARAVSSRRITLRDVAEQAGVQLACVSVVLNGAKSNTQVSPATRERIIAAAEELGYKRNGSMASMATGRFGCVALIVAPQVAATWLPGQLWEGIYDELARQNVHLSLFRLPSEELIDKEPLPKILREWMADGMLIVHNQRIPEQLKALITGHNLPAIWVNSKQEFDCVRPDDLAAGRNAAEHLLQLGHRRIAYLDLDFDLRAEDHYATADRYEGYLQAMRAADAQPQSHSEKSLPYESRALVIRRFLAECEERPTAVITYDGRTAEDVLWAAARLGWNVPRDLSVISVGTGVAFCDGIRVSAYQVPEYGIGQRASVMIQEKIAQPQHQLLPQVVPFDFYEGNSTAPPVV